MRLNVPLPRLTLTPLALCMVVAAYLLLAFNGSFWRIAVEIFGDRPITLGLFAVAMAALTVFLTLIGGFRWFHRAWLVFLILAGAGSAFFADRLGVIVNLEMIQNIANTQTVEARHLITPALAWSLGVWGVLPSLLVVWVRVRRKPIILDLLLWPLSAALAALITVAVLLVDFQSFASVFRQQRGLMSSYLPGAPLNDAIRYLRMVTAAQVGPMAPLGLDATRGARFSAQNRPTLIVLVIGETARAQNWGLNGYPRDTTPDLRRHAVVNFANVTACGTSTAISVPCMASVYGRADYSYEHRMSTENLLDVLGHAGLDVQWWENNAGHYGVASRVTVRRMTVQDDAEACRMGECTDAVFLQPLRDLAQGLTRDTVLVLHTIGSHGPAYSLRYPPEQARFLPACDDVDFQRCTPESIVNAYDNTLAFTDFVLGQMIDILGPQDSVAAALLYVSDHGESLGENGLYLHGSPWFMAPDTQTHVPMVLWLSDPLRLAFDASMPCLEARALEPQSQDVIFHTVLGLANVVTAVRDPALDLMAACGG